MTSRSPTAVPIDFSVLVDASTIDQTHAYALFATIVDGTSTWQNPTVLATQSLVPFPGRPFTEERTGGPPQLDIVVGYALDRIVFGKRSAAIARDKLAVDAASAAHADRVRTRVVEAVTAYVDYVQPTRQTAGRTTAEARFERATEAQPLKDRALALLTEGGEGR